ncbi:putative DUF3186 family protein [Corynebacterium mustelae]|uniref:Putative DUF3186 family protein n=1 Tax=Corynebacterium mustelae TaxID=571915 RepID=A0A0G3H415_9CORY|nr:copper transporter [Corynebacterium mustelae]AKK05867.1 putative DUF3186 family protein [Corynebacterium mustelae]
MKKGRSSILIAGIALGLAGGVAFSTFVLSPNLAGGFNQSLNFLSTERDMAQESARVAEAQANSADSFIQAVSEPAVKNSLSGKTIVVLRAADANDEDAKKLDELLKSAGVENVGTITLKETFFSQQGADGIKNVVSNTLPAGAKLSEDKLDPGTHSGESLGSTLMLNPETGQPQATEEERELGLTALQDAGFIEYEKGTVQPADAAILLIGDGSGVADDGFTETSQAAFAAAFDQRSGGFVVAGRIHSASDTGAIGKIRANQPVRDNVSTVDSIDRSLGLIAAVLATAEQIGGNAGAYGSAASADAAAPSPKILTE